MASHGINKAILIGNVGTLPDIKVTTGGKTIVNLSIATSESWKDKNTGEKVEKTEWHRIVFYDKLAEIVAQYVTKGSKMYLSGKLQTRKWTDKEGVERYSTEVVASEMQLLDSAVSGERASKPEQKQETEMFDDDIVF